MFFVHPSQSPFFIPQEAPHALYRKRNSEKTGGASSTLRYYDKESLLPFVERSSGGVRMFKESDPSWLSIIQCLKKTGMPIREIRKFVDWCLQGDDTIAQRLALIDRQRESVLKQIAQLQNTLETLNYKHWYCETAQRLGSCDALRTLNPADIPPEIQKIRERLRAGDSRP